MLRLFDSTTGEVRELPQRDAGRFSMYVCGPTVNGLPHLGHGRFSLVWDVVRRWLTWNGVEVDYVSNVTDIDDRIIKRADEESRAEAEVASQFECEWWHAMAGLGIAAPNRIPHATEYVPQMVELIQRLIAIDVAYETSDGVYFDVSKVPDYGVLSGQSVDSLRSGARVEQNDDKRSPLDFAVWKKAKPGEPIWPAPFGDGRPGWHTECVVMCLELLGDGFDFHAGGLDLRFPHHENERAQAVALGYTFAQRWAHNGLAMVGSVKMSKSLDNFVTLRELLARTDQRAYRLLVLRSHYRSPIEVAPEVIDDAVRALARLDTFARRFELPALAGKHLERRDDHLFEDHQALLDEVSAALDNDLDTPRALSRLFESVTECHTLADAGELDAARSLARAVGELLAALGLSLDSSADEIDARSAELVSQRDAARAARDFAAADRLRDELVAAGWIVEDSPTGTLIRR